MSSPNQARHIVVRKNDWCQEVRGVSIYIWHDPGVTHERLSQSPNKEAEKIVFVMAQILDKYEKGNTASSKVKQDTLQVTQT